MLVFLGMDLGPRGRGGVLPSPLPASGPCGLSAWGSLPLEPLSVEPLEEPLLEPLVEPLEPPVPALGRPTGPPPPAAPPPPSTPLW